jgi:hypothetical protein
MYNKICENCGKPFEQKYKANRKNKRCNEGRFCSLKCSGSFLGKERSVRNAKIRVANAVCGYCGKKFYMIPSRLGATSGNFRYCCRGHKDMAQRLDSGINSARPSHYGNGKASYREIAERELPHLCGCGQSFKGILEVHHKNGDRNVNVIHNLEFVCPVCHHLRHMKKTAKGWKHSKNCLTPRECLPSLEMEVFGRVITDVLKDTTGPSSSGQDASSAS